MLAAAAKTVAKRSESFSWTHSLTKHAPSLPEVATCVAVLGRHVLASFPGHLLKVPEHPKSRVVGAAPRCPDPSSAMPAGVFVRRQWRAWRLARAIALPLEPCSVALCSFLSQCPRPRGSAFDRIIHGRGQLPVRYRHHHNWRSSARSDNGTGRSRSVLLVASTTKYSDIGILPRRIRGAGRLNSRRVATLAVISLAAGVLAGLVFSLLGGTSGAIAAFLGVSLVVGLTLVASAIGKPASHGRGVMGPPESLRADLQWAITYGLSYGLAAGLVFAGILRVSHLHSSVGFSTWLALGLSLGLTESLSERWCSSSRRGTGRG